MAAMVDGRFRAPHPTAFTVTKSYTWRGAVLAVRSSASGAAVMDVETVMIGYHNLRCLHLLDAASRRPLITVEEVGTSGRRWQAIRGGGASRSNRLFVAIDRKRFWEMGELVEVFLEGNSSDGPDYTVHGSYYDGGGMTVSRGGGVGGERVARIGKEGGRASSVMSGEHTYHVKVGPDVDQALVLALTVILDQSHHYDVEICSCSCNHSSRHRSRTDNSNH